MPITIYLLFLINFFCCAASFNDNKYIVMINPSGDAKNPGRIIDDVFERGVSFQCAQQIKKQIESNNSHITVVLSRTPGQHVEPFHGAQFANRLSVDLYISLCFFHTDAEKRSITTYYYIQQPTDYWLRQSIEPTFISYDYAHVAFLPLTTEYAQKMKQLCDFEFSNKGYYCYGPFATRIKSLAGIIRPAVLIEIGIEKKDEWQSLVSPLAAIIQKTIYYTHE